ncbi:MAG TPA: ComF family protein [Gammaproteobacteria bacterium]|nr:ComF family protein [Gammaproteobacteria bacterium]
MVNNWIKQIQFKLLPGCCMLCGKLTGIQQDLCPACRSRLLLNDHHCRSCAQPLPSSIADGSLCGRCQKKPPCFDNCFAPFRYQDDLTSLHHSFKFHHKLAAGRLMADLMCEQLAIPSRKFPQLLIPVPLHAKRLRERGFNQAQELTRILSSRLSIDVDSHSLCRTRDTTAQSSLPKKERQKNIRNAFALSAKIDSSHVAIIDDVMTTGLTVNEISKTLRRSGVSEIEIWVFARTP